MERLRGGCAGMPASAGLVTAGLRAGAGIAASILQFGWQSGLLEVPGRPCVPSGFCPRLVQPLAHAVTHPPSSSLPVAAEQVRGQFIGHYLSGIAFAALHTGGLAGQGRLAVVVHRLRFRVRLSSAWVQPLCAMHLWFVCCGGSVLLRGGGRCDFVLTVQQALLQHVAYLNGPFKSAGRQDMHARCDLMVGELKKVQDAYGNGYLGAPLSLLNQSACAAWAACWKRLHLRPVGQGIMRQGAAVCCCRLTRSA